jgi:uncharacterized protein YbjT (DUF2867 family)
MYASVRHYTIGAGSIDSLMHRVDEEFAPAISQEPGFVAYLALDTGDGKLETVSIFRDKATADASDELAADYVRDRLGEFDLTRIEVTSGEVVVGRVTAEALGESRRWRTGRARSRVFVGPEAATRPVLVVGATGRTGRMIVDSLLERGVPVQALVRDAARGDEVLPPGLPRCVGDLLHPETLAEAMAGAGSVIVAISGSADHGNTPELVDYHGTRNLVEQAAAADVELLVYVSTIYASRPEHYEDVEPTSLGWKARGEEVIRASGIPYSIVRSGWLTDKGGGQPLAMSQGDTAEGQIARADLAGLCAELLFMPEARGKTFEVIAAHDGPAPSLPSAVGALAPDG